MNFMLDFSIFIHKNDSGCVWFRIFVGTMNLKDVIGWVTNQTNNNTSVVPASSIHVLTKIGEPSTEAPFTYMD